MQLRKSYTILLAIYLLTSLLIPLTAANKVIFVLLLAIYAGYLLFVKKEQKFEFLQFTMAPLVIIAVFGYGFVLGMLGRADLALAKQFLLAVGVLLLIYPIREFEINLNGVIKQAAKIYIIFFAVYVVYAINRMDFALPVWMKNGVHLLDNGVTQFIGNGLHELCSGILTKRSFFGGSGMQIYLGTTPFLLILTDVLFVDVLKNKKYSNFIFIGLAMLMTFTTGSRTLILLMPVSMCVLFWVGLDRKKQILIAAVLCAAGAAAVGYLLLFSNFFSLSESSNFVKAGHIRSYFEQLDLKNALLGNGLASFYDSAGTMYEVAHTEITFLDHCRYFGIPLAVLVWFLLIVPNRGTDWKQIKCWRVWQMKEEMMIFLMYLFFAQTNPVLFNSFGLMAVLWYWNVWMNAGIQKKGRNL